MDYVTMIMEHKDNLKVLSINKVLQRWPYDFQQFGSYVTKMSDVDKDMLQIADLKVVYSKLKGANCKIVLEFGLEN